MIKSKIILKKIFSILNDRNKFKLVLYNKRLHNYLGLDINDFKRYSGRYILIEKDGKGKEYNGYSDKVLYEGEYIKGKRNGKGKEYNEEGILIFEGEFFNNKWLNGKEYNKYGELTFEGEFLNGLRNGKGKEFYDNKLI